MPMELCELTVTLYSFFFFFVTDGGRHLRVLVGSNGESLRITFRETGREFSLQKPTLKTAADVKQSVKFCEVLALTFFEEGRL